MKTKVKVRYRTVVDSDVVYDSNQFAREIAHYLADPDGWVSEGYTFEQSDRADTLVHLSSPSTLKTNGCRNDKLSCAEMNGEHVWINAQRWANGSKASGLSLEDYRQYVVTHEMGHHLGYDHVKCPGRGDPAPLMMQQTLGIGECRPNTKLTDSDRKKRR